MALTEDEEFELLSLEREKAMNDMQVASSQEPVQAIPQTRFQLKSEQPYDNYSYGDAMTDTGKTVINSLANLGHNVTQPILHPIQTLQSLAQGVGQAISDPVGTAKGIGQQLTSTDNPDNIPNWAYAMHNDPINTAVNIAGVGVGGAVAARGLPGAINATANVSKNAPNIIKQLVKYDSALEQAGKSKVALDSLRNTIGKAKEIAIQSVENAPVKYLNSSKATNKVIDAIKNPVYEVQFDQFGGVVKTVGNLDRMKNSVGDLMNGPDWVSAAKTEKRMIKQFYGELSKSMIKGARDAGTDIAPQITAYSKFMEKYPLVNKTLVDSAGIIHGNKIKAAFRFGAEPAVKEAWKEVSKASPEIKSVMNSMNRRELLRQLTLTPLRKKLFEF